MGKRVAMKLKERISKFFEGLPAFCWSITYNELKLIFITLSQQPNTLRFSLYQAGRNLVHLKNIYICEHNFILLIKRRISHTY